METRHLSLFVMLCLGVQRSSSEILQRQKRNWIIDSFSIDEGYKGPFPYSLGKIDTVKGMTFFKIQGQGADEKPVGVLTINKYTGEITVHKPVDYEDFRVLKLVFQAVDRQNHVVDTQLGIEVLIIDANDNPPRFDREKYEITIKESTAQGTDIITIMASDDDANESNKMFDFKIISVTPAPYELEFYLIQIPGTETGTISFKGCLDHERAEKYTLIVEAKDHGEKQQLASSSTVIITIEDGNNHIPVITGQTGPSRVKEAEENVLVSRLEVTDADTKGTGAWRAKYQIQGDTNNNFRITTDPETNEGLLYVEKPLDYEDTPLKNLTIKVENEVLYQTCKVVSRRTTGLWEVVTTTGGASAAGGVTGTVTLGQSIRRVTVVVEDVNESPIFDKPNKQVTLSENIVAGQYLETFTARDPDVANANSFVYSKGKDPANWITVDSATGKITTSKALDRESEFVKDSIYTVTIHAIDNGKPPMTATATLSIHITDENDNSPTLVVSTFDMCQSDGPSLANITALDLDGDPYGGPFRFKLLGDVKGKWKVDPSQGYSVNLVKESTVHSGHFELLLEVSDLQHNAVVHNLSVTVCDCFNTERPNCRSRKSTGSAAGGGALGIFFFSILLLAGVLLLALFMSCKRPHIKIPEEDSGQHLMKSNTEKPGNDCTVALEKLHKENGQNKKIIPQVPVSTLNQKITQKTTGAVSLAYSEHATSKMEQQRRNYLNWSITNSANEASKQGINTKNTMEQDITRRNFMHWSMDTSSTMRTSGHQDVNSMHKSMDTSSTMRTSGHQDVNSMHKSMDTSSTMRTSGHQDINSMHKSMDASSTMRTRHQNEISNSMYRSWMTGGKYFANIEIGTHREILLKVLHKMMYNLYAQEEELHEDVPHVYDEEGESVSNFDLDAISIPDISFDPDKDFNNFKFKTLASICMPSESTAYSTKTLAEMEKLETATLIQEESQKTIMNTQSHFDFENTHNHIFDQVINPSL